MKKEFDDLLSRKMERKEFLAYMGAVALSVFGVIGLLRALRHSHRDLKSITSTHRDSGYGSGGYGKG